MNAGSGKNMLLSLRELNVINILAAKAPATSTDICNGMHDLTQSTVIAVLRKLLAANLVEVTGVTHSGKVLSRQYALTSAGKQAVINHFLTELESVSNIISIDDIQNALK